MPGAAVLQTNGTSGGTAQGTATARGTAGMGVNPFRRATREHTELVAQFNFTMTTADQNIPNGVVSIPAYGYVRGIIVTVVVSGGVAGTAFQEDAPLNILKNIIFGEPNGAPINQWNTGWEMGMSKKYGGFKANSDVRAGIYAATMPNFQVQYWIPIELCQRDGLGSLPNQNAAAMFQLRFQVAGSGDVYTTTPTTQPSVQVTVEAAEYDQPQASADGQANQTTPPAMNTTQFWTVQQYPIVSGFNRVRLTRVGNYIRHLGFVHRRTASTRANGDADFPASLELDLDARPLDFIRKLTWRQNIYDRYGYDTVSMDTKGNQDNGVFWYDFCHEFDGSVGEENRDGWLKTYGSSRLEIAGTWAQAGTLTVITNDVAVASNVFLPASM